MEAWIQFLVGILLLQIPLHIHSNLAKLPSPKLPLPCFQCSPGSPACPEQDHGRAFLTWHKGSLGPFYVLQEANSKLSDQTKCSPSSGVSQCPTNMSIILFRWIRDLFVFVLLSWSHNLALQINSSRAWVILIDPCIFSNNLFNAKHTHTHHTHFFSLSL